MRKLQKLIDPSYINSLLEQYSKKKILIKVKTCQDLVESGNSDYKTRHGRFTLDKDEHTMLLNKKGFYLFLVKNNGFVLKGRVISAEDITFTKQLMWKFVLGNQ